MSGAAVLDEFLTSQPASVHNSERRLAKFVREAYPIGVPAMIMKSSTDRIGESAGYSFHLGTPDEILRLIASWLLTEAGADQSVLRKLVKRLWKRHGREDVALAALILANLDFSSEELDPWEILASSINQKEPADAILLSIEEILRAGHPRPTVEMLVSWCNGRMVDSHLALISTYVAFTRSGELNEEVKEILAGVKVPSEDSLLRRIKTKLEGAEP